MPEGKPDYETEILAHIVQKVGVRAKKGITLDSLLKEDCGFDSLDGVETTQDLEVQYNITIPDEVAQSWKQGKDIVTYLKDPEGYIASRNITLKSTQS